MPEAPEVETLNQELFEILVNTNSFSINDFTFIKGKYKDNPPSLMKRFIKEIKRDKYVISDVTRRGKILSFEFKKTSSKNSNASETWWICCTMGLNGMFRFNGDKVLDTYDKYPTDNKSYKNIHATFELDSDKTLDFYDTRGYGTTFNFFNEVNNYVNYLYRVAIDLYDEEFTFEVFNKNIEIVKKKIKKDKAICSILLNQSSICSGIGNYLKCEILYDAKFHPEKMLSSFTNEDFRTLYDSIKKVSKIHLESSGKNFSKINVYMRNLDRKSNIVESSITSDKRTSYYVNSIQKK
jgi:formamidopyrimidine-DNA glycosylase